MAHMKGNMDLMKGNMALIKGNMALTKGNMALRHVRKELLRRFANIWSQIKQM